jgi:hypothetical protein
LRPRTGKLELWTHVVLSDLLAHKATLNPADFIKRMLPLLPDVPDMPDDDGTRLMRCLLDVDLPFRAPEQEWLQAYVEAGVGRGVRRRDCGHECACAPPFW